MLSVRKKQRTILTANGKEIRTFCQVFGGIHSVIERIYKNIKNIIVAILT